MNSRRKSCFKAGSVSEKRFAAHLDRIGIDYTIEVGTDADLKGKVDFVVRGQTVNVKAPTRSGPPGLCVEWRAVNGSTGWLHKIDHVVKFIDSSTYWRIPCSKLKELVVTTRGEPPVRCPQTGAGRSNGAWYARQDWEGKDRTGEACIMLSLEELRPIAKVIKT